MQVLQIDRAPETSQKKICASDGRDYNLGKDVLILTGPIIGLLMIVQNLLARLNLQLYDDGQYCDRHLRVLR